MEVKPFLFDRFVLGFLVQLRAAVPRPGPVKRVGYERRDGAEHQGREIENARRQNLRVSRRESGVGVGVGIEDRDWDERVEAEILEGVVAALVELEDERVEPWPCSLSLVEQSRRCGERDLREQRQ